MSHTKQDQVTPHFTWYEVEHSETAERLGINNIVPESMEWVIQKTALLMERVRAILNSPIKVNSWYRSPAMQELPQFYNPSSQHPKGEAVDFVSPAFGSPVEVCKKLLAQKEFTFDQMILEHTWIHLSYNSIPSAVQKKQVLSLLKNNRYAIGLTDVEGNPL